MAKARLIVNNSEEIKAEIQEKIRNYEQSLTEMQNALKSESAPCVIS